MLIVLLSMMSLTAEHERTQRGASIQKNSKNSREKSAIKYLYKARVIILWTNKMQVY